MQPQRIQKVEDRELRLTWDDGHVSAYTFRYIRQICPCALCKDEFTGKRILDPESVPGDLRAQRAELVGNYALSFQFSDGHSSGVFSFDLLRKNCPCCLPRE